MNKEEIELDKIGKQLLKFPNVTGYSKKLRKRIREGKVVDEWCLQVHVDKKRHKKELRIIDVLPIEVNGVPIDVVAKGVRRFLAKKTDCIRPLVGGISIGNEAITAGTLGDFSEKLHSPDKGEIFMDSNGHVLADDPTHSPEQVRFKNILQPGDADDGKEVVGTYYWHQQLYPEIGLPSDCMFSKGVTGSLNLLSQLLHRQSRFEARVTEVNHADYAVARIEVPWVGKHFDVDYDPNRFQHAGKAFAGGDVDSIFIKPEYIKEAGYWPPGYEMAEINVGDTIHKTGRTSCHTKKPMNDDSLVVRVLFGNVFILFDDVYATDKQLDPGDSGSGSYKEL